jgi:CHAD domain-containing protein
MQVMAYRFAPGQPISQNAREAGTEQIDRVLAHFSDGGKGNAVHESRKAIKRLRALLRLIKPGMSKAAFRRDEARLKEIARLLSGVRDMQAMIETAAKLEAYDPAVGAGPVGVAMKGRLEQERAEAEKRLKGGATGRTRKLLAEARKAFAGLTLDNDACAGIAKTLENDYRKARLGFASAYRLGKDEAFHDWRKHVQRHWRQLVLLAPSWSKALRPQVALARDLAEILGEDHDMSVLATRVRADAKQLGPAPQVRAYLKLCQRRQAELRSLAEPLAARLLAEKPSSLAARLTAYWTTAPQLDDAEQDAKAAKSNNVIALKRSPR